MIVSANADASKTGDCGPSFLTEYVRYSTNYKQVKQYKKWKLKYWEQDVAARERGILFRKTDKLVSFADITKRITPCEITCWYI